MVDKTVVKNNIGISFKALFLDYQSLNGGDITALREYHNGFEIAVHKYITNNISVNVPVKVGVVQSHEGPDCFHKSVYGADIQGNYEFMKEGWRVQPYVLAGIGGVLEDDGEFNLQVPVGAGLKLKIADNAFINWQSEYRKSLGENRDNFHHGVGFIYYIGKRKAEKLMVDDKKEEMDADSDGDGIMDEFDLCPQSPGTEALNGCPDTDGDGLADYEDACPENAGSREMQGCPDSDGDGISDRLDECPNLAGPIETNGCPSNDSDNDGIPNNLDKCPDRAGTAANNGCPELDSDGDGIQDVQDKCPTNAGPSSTGGCPDRDNDGVADYEDRCPSSPGLKAYGGCPDSDGDGIDDSRDSCPDKPGTVAANGCPEIASEDKAVLDLAMRAVQFDTGRSTLKSESFDILNQIANLMAKYPDFNLNVNGHTDSQGDARSNQILSENRSKTCYEYLIKRGVSASRLGYKGYGETTPIANNNTLRGRALNRRVEFQMSIR